MVPAGCLSRLLQAVGQDSLVDPWVRALRDLLRQQRREEESSPPPAPLSLACQEQLRCLCRKITQNKAERQRKLNWCFSKQTGATGSAAEPAPQGVKRKKASEESLELDEGRERKRPLLEEGAFDPLGTQDGGDAAEVEEEVPGDALGDGSAQSVARAAPEKSSQDAAREPRKMSQAELAAEVQSFLQVHGPRLKMLLQREPSHLELSLPPELQILNNCSAAQLEGLCSFLQLSTCPEHLLVRFCSWLLALSPNLSYTNAAVLAEQLFLQRVLSLAQPPSRHLMAALASFCSKYSQPFCRVLVAAVLREPGEGAEQTKLLCELVEECLEPDYVRLVLSQVLELPLSEKLLPVLQAVLGRQEVLPSELFDLLVLTLCRQAPALATSLDYAKLVMAMLTMYQSQVTPAHRSRLAAALDRSNAALKKSLQAVLEEAREQQTELAGISTPPDEDAETPEEPLLSFPSELSVLERLGLHRVALTEQDVEAAFAHLALAFRCDVFTLQQRVQVEKRARDAAEENIQEELGQCRAALEEARMSRAAEVMVQHVENLKRHHMREHAELEEMKRLIQQNSRNRQLAETQDDTEPRLRSHPLVRTFQQGSARRRVSIAVIPKQLLPGATLDSRAAPSAEPEGAQRRPSTQRSEPEPQGQGSAVTTEPVAKVDSKGLSAGGEEPEQLGLTSKESPAELWRPWFFLPQHYWVFLWLLLLSISFLLLIHVLELQRLQRASSPKA
ncbi:PREDICTED: Fanconi anemia group E protein [Mesitornis unicolor]|uniref:Fanconi anemia group E protein n=1 Tax=Mesitornis unicolor TaxID=54374 RepID=UPI0005292236|nr:PREDICTED: Fanconi anemia group E protein [Mesitornis unicolor]